MPRSLACMLFGFCLALGSGMAPAAQDPDPLQRARELNAEVLQHIGAGRYAEGIPTAREALAIHEQALGLNHPNVAASLINLAELLRLSGDYAAARPLYERALTVLEQALGPTHPHVATNLNNLALLLQATGDYTAARPLYERALAMREQALGPTHLEVAQSLNNLAALLQATGDYAAARPLYERALTIHEQALGPTHPHVALSLNNLAALLQAAGNHTTARPLYERALQIARQTRTPEWQWRPALGLGQMLELEGQLAEALALYQEAVKTLEGLAGQLGDEALRMQYLQAENRLEAYDALARLALKLHQRDSHKGYDRDAWAVLEAKKKRVAAEALAAVRLEPQDRQAREEAQKTKARQDQALALEKALRAERARPPQEQRPERVQNLTTLLAQTKAEYLAQVQAFLERYPRYKMQFVDQQTVDPRTLAKFAQRLPAGTLAVQYFAAPDALYLFVVAPGGQFQVRRQAVAQVDLYALVKEYRQYLERGVGQRLPWTDDGSEVYRQEVVPLQALTQKLAAHLLQPIEAELQAYQNLVLIPNDLLLYLPFHALTRVQADGTVRFLAETHAVSSLTQLELVDLLNPGHAVSHAPLLALANPDGSLPAASREIRTLLKIRPAVTSLEGPQATKTRFLSLAAQFPDLHLATHGVLDPQRPERSYLLMAGADEGSERLGIGEIAGLSLPPNGLVILSACETALGEQVPGAALLTLAAAFSQAGSQSIVASLWKVHDAATRDFMVTFHRALRTANRATAFQQAQVAVLQEPLTAHPYYWAAFILIGAR